MPTPTCTADPIEDIGSVRNVADDVGTRRSRRRRPMKPGTALYLRVSTEEQTTANQLPGLKRLAKARELSIVRVYEESVSAVKVRPQFDAMIAAAHRGEFSVLIVWSLDRFGRSAIGNLRAVLELDEKGVKVVSLQEPWLEMDGPVRTLLIYIISWVAEQERARMIERTRAGMDRARSEGKQIGRPRVIFSTRSVETMMRAQGATVASVAKLLKVSRSSVQRAIRASKGGVKTTVV